jgi:hypothetical protein
MRIEVILYTVAIWSTATPSWQSQCSGRQSKPTPNSQVLTADGDTPMPLSRVNFLLDLRVPNSAAIDGPKSASGE